jgi:excinuclease ABC subunit A
MLEKIVVRGARENNLKGLSVEIPRGKLCVMTGVSGSGKSTLAFGTIFAECQRRFMESLSSYARQFLGNFKKPAVDGIEGLSPAIAINQKTTSHNPRSTVGTVTEIYDYLRLLYARIGDIYCPKCGKPISRQSIDQIVSQILTDFTANPTTVPHSKNTGAGDVLYIMAPAVRGEKGTFQKELEQYRRSGYARVKIDGSIYTLDERIELDKNIRHTISVIVDRIRVAGEPTKETIARITESVETATRLTDGLVLVDAGEGGRSDMSFETSRTVRADKSSLLGSNKGEFRRREKDISDLPPSPPPEKIYSNKYACIDCGISIEDLEPRHFSFNSPFGACPNCTGLGFTYEIDEDLIDIAKISSWWTFSENHFAKMSKQQIIDDLKRRFKETTSDYVRTEIGKLMIRATCPVCGGKRLKSEALAVRIGNSPHPISSANGDAKDNAPTQIGTNTAKSTPTQIGINIADLTAKSIRDTISFFDDLKNHITPTQAATAEAIIKEVSARLNFLKNVGLHYLTLGRNADSLSGGESQRIRLATQIGSGLVGVLYILDEPSIGLHQADNDKLLGTLKQLRDLGNTLIIVEHDEDTIRAADYVVDIGSRAGVKGGELVAAGTVADIEKCEKSLTGDYLSGRRKIEVPKTYRPTGLNSSGGVVGGAVGSGGGKKEGAKDGEFKYIEVQGASENNLKNIDVKFPLGTLIAVTGPSGSGKSSLVNKILYPALYNTLNRGSMPCGGHNMLAGFQNVEKVIDIDQSPIGRTPRSNPATYTDVFGGIRELFASTRDAKERGYTAGRFSFNVRGGRCDNCDGDGIKKIEMHFLPDVYVPCEVCGGKRFNRETLEVKFKGKSIYDVLEMTVDEAVEFYANFPAIYNKLKTIQDVGLGYIHLGQSATSLSGGEAQRVKLAKELSRASKGKSVYILDEPTTGLHAYDVHKLINILQRLVGAGNTVIVIEHNLDVIKVCDHVIDLGPTGGAEGGYVIATGNPREIAANGRSLTGKYLKNYL